MSHLSIGVVLLVLAFTPALSELCNPQDKKVLLQIKKELGNPSNLSSWNPTTDCCDNNWEGVTCGAQDQSYRVYVLDLTDVYLPKPHPIPPSIGNLPYLKMLRFNMIPNMVGTIPPIIAKLTNLRSLSITYTSISGQIPLFLSQMKTLESIDFSYNKLSGNLPHWLPSLPNIFSLSLDRNRFSGPIPDSFGSFPEGFTYLTLSGNRLTGNIPATLAKLDLKIVDLSKNMLEGDASLLFGSAKHTERIYLANNRFSFDLGKVGLSKILMILDVSHNRLYGTLPKRLPSLKHLIWLDVSYNNLCGEIPQGGNMKDISDSAYAHNNCLCGSPLPTCKRF
ncbi:hypothetical protein VNO78_11438 [Psophocarpus tetragonolobus]|uniref:Leucine-rich repeat-containing N-terminal plant-type domain-containing protein n=1 Tax=Psophocarpus tetragonolobus TaxID=3891 RepID=A0AAN9XNY3_PSOTE